MEERLSTDGLLSIDQLFKEFSNSPIIVVFTKVSKSLASSSEMEKTFNEEMLYFYERRVIIGS